MTDPITTAVTDLFNTSYSDLDEELLKSLVQDVLDMCRFMSASTLRGAAYGILDMLDVNNLEQIDTRQIIMMLFNVADKLETGGS